VRVSADHASVYPAGRLHAALLEELRVERPPAQRFDTGSSFERFSAERIPELDADVVFVYGVDEGPDHAQALTDLQGNPLGQPRRDRRRPGARGAQRPMERRHLDRRGAPPAR